MEDCRRHFLIPCLIAMTLFLSVSSYAETVEEKKIAANYDETLSNQDEAQADEEAASDQEIPVEAQPVKPSVQPVPAMPVAIPAVSGATMGGASVSSPLTVTDRTNVPSNPGAIQPVTQSRAVEAKENESKPVVSQAASKSMPEDQVFGAVNPSGLVEVSGYKYPVFLFAPKDYKTDRTYAMIMIAPAENTKAERQIETLTGLAQRKSIFVLAPYVLWPKVGDTPYTLDGWLLKVKNDIVERFPINKKRVYLIGKDSGAHYAAYMGVKYPKEFCAVALLGEAWEGPFSQLVVPRSDTSDQVPFYIALKADGDARSRNQAWFDRLQQAGYPLHLVDYKTDADLDDLEFKKSVYDWMEATSQSWAVSVAKSQEGWKGKFKKGVKDFFAV